MIFTTIPSSDKWKIPGRCVKTTVNALYECENVANEQGIAVVDNLTQGHQ